MRNFMEKVILLTITLVFLIFTIHAQALKKGIKPTHESVFSSVNKGKWMLGGDLYLQSHRFNGADPANDSKENTIGFSPFIGYFVKNQLAVGLVLDYSSIKSEGANTDDLFSQISLGPAVRYYLSITTKFMFFGEAKVPFGRVNRTVNGVQLSPLKTIGISLSPGFAFFASDKFSFHTKFGQLSYRSQKQGDDQESFVDFSLAGSNLTLGLNYHFGN